MPSTTSALFLAIGIPRSLVTFFSCMYAELKRYLSYKSWTSDFWTTSANGLVQGCSLSLLAINTHMMIWSVFLEELPGISASAFIDDAYLFAKLNHIENLTMAYVGTTWRGNLTGQLANKKKTVAWATSSKARSIMKNTFPDVSHKHCVDVLGAIMQTTSKHEYGWDKNKIEKVLKELRLIKAIPTCRSIHDHLIGTKIIPQISHAAHISLLPKAEMKRVQDGIVSILWKNKPLWRARPLVMCFLAKPHRTDPVLARHYTAIIECVTFLKTCPNNLREMWNCHFQSLTTKMALVVRFRDACDALKIRCVSPFHFQTLEAQPVCFLDFGLVELKAVLQLACRMLFTLRQQNYTEKTSSKQKASLIFTTLSQAIQSAKRLKLMVLHCFHFELLHRWV